MGAGSPLPAAGWELITEENALAALVERLLSADRYALDTEFHRERTYWPRVAVVQVAWPAVGNAPAGVGLIDAQAVSLGPLGEVLASEAVMVAHAADQDLQVLELACGRGPSRLFDTQVGAGFIGHGSASLTSLCSALLGVEVAKGDRLSDWSRRPLTDAQLAYAAADVEHLLSLADVIIGRLELAGRRDWAEEECELLRERPHGAGDPSRAWWRLRDARQLRGAARGVAQEVAAWRERRAQATDQPIRFVLPDLALQSIAHNPPADRAALARVRGLDQRHLGGGAPEGLLAAVVSGRHLPESAVCAPPAEEVSRELRPAIALAMSWVAQLARAEGVDATVLATRGDLVSYLRGEPDARLSHGWRGAMVGEPLQALIEGRASLAFDGRGGLVLERRSREPWLGAAPSRGPSVQ